MTEFRCSLRACGAELTEMVNSPPFIPMILERFPPEALLLRRMETLTLACSVMTASIGVHAITLDPASNLVSRLDSILKSCESGHKNESSFLVEPVINQSRQKEELDEGPPYLYTSRDCVELAADIASMLADATVVWDPCSINVGGLRMQRPPTSTEQSTIAESKGADSGLLDIDEDLHGHRSDDTGSSSGSMHEQAAGFSKLISTVAASLRSSLLKLLVTVCDVLSWRDAIGGVLDQVAALKEIAATENANSRTISLSVGSSDNDKKWWMVPGAAASIRRKALVNSFTDPDTGLTDPIWVLDIVERVLKRFLPAAFPASSVRLSNLSVKAVDRPLPSLKTSVGNIDIPATSSSWSTLGAFLQVCDFFLHRSFCIYVSVLTENSSWTGPARRARRGRC